jgi:hypothetical protein
MTRDARRIPEDKLQAFMDGFEARSFTRAALAKAITIEFGYMAKATLDRYTDYALTRYCEHTGYGNFRLKPAERIAAKVRDGTLEPYGHGGGGQ